MPNRPGARSRSSVGRRGSKNPNQNRVLPSARYKYHGLRVKPASGSRAGAGAPQAGTAPLGLFAQSLELAAVGVREGGRACETEL
jgi:hypothetical protein